MKELSSVTVAASSPTTLLPCGTRSRLVHDGDEIVFIETPFFRSERTVLRYPVSQLVLVRGERIPSVPAGWGPIIEMLQVFRNTQKYGFWDGMAATNLQNLDARPRETVPVIKLAFFVPGAEYEIQFFMLIERWRSEMPIVDCAAYLRSLMLKRRRV